MRSVEENIEALSHALLNEAKAEAEQIMADASAKAEAIRKRAQDQASAVRKEILERAQQEADRLRSQVVATTQMKARTEELAHREKLLDQAFTNARQQLASVEQWSDYREIALGLLKEAVAQLRSKEVRVRVDARTRQILTDAVIADISKEMNARLIMGELLQQGTGVVVETIDGHLQFDNTLETRLDRLMNTLRAPVYRILIGEPK
jgi:V/A-type H+/Na+-transporting ATPase subunit E